MVHGWSAPQLLTLSHIKLVTFPGTRGVRLEVVTSGSLEAPGLGVAVWAVGDSLGRDWGKKEICEDAYILVQAREDGSLHTGPRSEK